MMQQLLCTPIGVVHAEGDEFLVEIAPEYRAALTGLDGFSYVQLLWWFDGCDNADARKTRVERKPYTNGPDVLGTFATRSPARPHPIALTTEYVTYVDIDAGVVGLAYLDAADGSPVLDVKPYTPSLDRVEAPEVPAWCAHWPKNVESSGDFDWAREFNF